jgi:hypothetical protein
MARSCWGSLLLLSAWKRRDLISATENQVMTFLKILGTHELCASGNSSTTGSVELTSIVM